MENPPPGYNPNVSLLSGGTGTILPVQGGGGGYIPTNYNPNQSLLEGGTGTIQAIRGGGDAKVKFTNTVEIKEIPNVSNPNIETPGENTLELYKLEKKERKVPKALDNKERIERTESYANRRLKFVYYDDIKSMGTSKTYQALTYKICSQKDFDFASQPQKIVIERIKNPRILVVPNLNGDLQKFLAIKEFLETKKFLEENNHFLVFTGEFFSEDATQNHLLLDEYIDLLRKYTYNVQRIFNIFSLNENAKNQMCSYMKKGEDFMIPFLLEPHVLFFEDIKLIITADALPANMIGFIEKSPNEKSFYIPPAKVLSEAAGGKPFKSYLQVKNYFVVAVNTNMPKSKIPKESSIQCPPDQYKCPEFQGGYSLSKLANPFSIVEPQEDVYLFYKNENQLHLPYFREEKETEPKELPMTQRQMLAQAEANAAAATAAAPAAAPPVPAPAPSGTFQASPDAKDSTNLFSFSIEMKNYKIRFATEDVKKDWKNEIFIQEEADFLNALHLTPKLLQDVFQDEWKNKVASFLESLVDSKCFQDTNLLMNVKCKDARAFLQSVYMQMYTNTLDDLYKQWGSQSPQKDKQMLLDKILQKMTKVAIKPGLAEKLKQIKLSDEPSLITKEDFRGDPSGRYLDFHVNTHDPTLPWFMNYVEKEKNATGAEKQFFKRLYGKNPEDVLEKYRRLRQGIPVPPAAAPAPSAVEPAPPAPAPAPPPVEPSPEPPASPAPEPPSPATTVAAAAPTFQSKLPAKTYTNFKTPKEALDHLDSLLSEMEDHIEGRAPPPQKSLGQRMKNRFSKIKLPGTRKGGKQTKYRLTRKRFVHKI